MNRITLSLLELSLSQLMVSAETVEEKWLVFPHFGHATVITFRPSLLCNIGNEVSLSSGLPL